MKRLFIMLIIAFAAITTTTALAQKKQVANTPKNVIKSFEFITDLHGQKDKQTYSITKNPNTGIIESKEVITHFICDKSDPYITMMGDDFHKDEPVSYQLHHIAKGNTENFNLKVVTNDSQKNNYLRIRTKQNQEMWFMCCKNPTNPQLRDAYAIVWEDINNDKVEGDIFMITSLRPDIYEEKITTSRKTFRIDGRVGYDLKDSLYVFYMADTYEKLNDLVMMTDSYEELLKFIEVPANRNYVALMPVSNKRFELNVDIDKPMGGRIRTVMPDGSLCKLWTNIDMVPGETYRITTHNGYYDEDRDYELRFGHYSQNGMFQGRGNDDVEMTGGYNDGVAIEDTVAIDDDGEGKIVSVHDPLANLTDAQKAEMQQKVKVIGERAKLMEGLYKTISEQLNNTVYISDKPSKWSNMDSFFNQITDQNKLIDTQFGDLIKTARQYNVPNIEIIKVIKEGVIGFYTDQNKQLNECYMKFGYLSKAATKCQKQVNKLTEKYMKELSKQMELIK